MRTVGILQYIHPHRLFESVMNTNEKVNSSNSSKLIRLYPSHKRQSHHPSRTRRFQHRKFPCKRWAAEFNLEKLSANREIKNALVDFMARNSVIVDEGIEQMEQDFPGRQILKSCYRRLREVGSIHFERLKNRKCKQLRLNIRCRLRATLSNFPRKTVRSSQPMPGMPGKVGI